MKYVIIGHSTAAIGCVEGIRQVDKAGEILLLSKERYPTYSRPLISYLIQGKTDLERMRYRPHSFFEKNNCQVRLGCEVVKIDPDTKEVVIQEGERVGYDKLLVATGSRAFVPPIQGIENVPYHTFMSLEDAVGLQEYITKVSRVLIVGAGLIGLKCAEALQGKVKHIEVCDLAPNILSSILDETGSKMVQKHLEAEGINFALGVSLARVEEKLAFYSDGRGVAFDVLVIAGGVRPNKELVAEVGGQVDKGIVVDSYCQTTLADIYSAGDCTESYDMTTDTQKVLALLPNAYWQGRCAGYNMAGEAKVYEKAMPMNAIGFMGLHMITAGTLEGQMYTVENSGSYKKLAVKDGRLIGFVMIGEVERAGIYTALIRERRLLSDIDFDLIKEKPQLMAFAKKERIEMLGGA
ncbi:MAG: NAD(P)/FAD-dependent oxidoreductase [Cellulosilyticaceae bacterium]